MFIKEQKGKETQKLEQTQFYVIAFDLKKKKKSLALAGICLRDYHE